MFPFASIRRTPPCRRSEVKWPRSDRSHLGTAVVCLIHPCCLSYTFESGHYRFFRGHR